MNKNEFEKRVLELVSDDLLYEEVIRRMSFPEKAPKPKNATDKYFEDKYLDAVGEAEREAEKHSVSMEDYGEALIRAVTKGDQEPTALQSDRTAQERFDSLTPTQRQFMKDNELPAPANSVQYIGFKFSMRRLEDSINFELSLDKGKMTASIEEINVFHCCEELSVESFDPSDPCVVPIENIGYTANCYISYVLNVYCNLGFILYSDVQILRDRHGDMYTIIKFRRKSRFE